MQSRGGQPKTRFSRPHHGSLQSLHEEGLLGATAVGLSLAVALIKILALGNRQ